MAAELNTNRASYLGITFNLGNDSDFDGALQLTADGGEELARLKEGSVAECTALFQKKVAELNAQRCQIEESGAFKETKAYTELLVKARARDTEVLKLLKELEAQAQQLQQAIDDNDAEEVDPVLVAKQQSINSEVDRLTTLQAQIGQEVELYKALYQEANNADGPATCRRIQEELGAIDQSSLNLYQMKRLELKMERTTNVIQTALTKYGERPAFFAFQESDYSFYMAQKVEEYRVKGFDAVRARAAGIHGEEDEEKGQEVDERAIGRNSFMRMVGLSKRGYTLFGDGTDTTIAVDMLRFNKLLGKVENSRSLIVAMEEQGEKERRLVHLGSVHAFGYPIGQKETDEHEHRAGCQQMRDLRKAEVEQLGESDVTMIGMDGNAIYRDRALPKGESMIADVVERELGGAVNRRQRLPTGTASGAQSLEESYAIDHITAWASDGHGGNAARVENPTKGDPRVFTDLAQNGSDHWALAQRVVIFGKRLQPKLAVMNAAHGAASGVKSAVKELGNLFG